jgi:hypothetical protein
MLSIKLYYHVVWSDYRFLDSSMDLLTTYTHDSELQAVTVPPQISTIHKSPQHPLSLFKPAVSSPAVPRPQLLTVEILHLHSLKSSLHRLLYRTDWTDNRLGHPSFHQDNSSARTTQKHPVSNSTSIVAFRFVAAGMCLLSRCLEMCVVYWSISVVS